MKHQPPVPLRRASALTPDDRVVSQMLSELPDARPDRATLDRVWRQLPRSSPAPSLARRWWLISAAIPALAVVVLLRGRESQLPARAELVSVAGGVFPDAPGPSLGEHQHVRTDASGQALLRQSGVASWLLSDNTELTIERLEKGTTLQLSKGTVTARVSKRPANEPFVVEAGRFRVRVVGTLFSVSTVQDGRITVSVREGTVEVLDQTGRVATVTRGASWTSDSENPWEVDHISDAVRSLLEEGLAGRLKRDLIGGFAEVRRKLAPSGSKTELAPEPERTPDTPRPVVVMAQPIRPAHVAAPLPVAPPSISPSASNLETSPAIENPPPPMTVTFSPRTQLPLAPLVAPIVPAPVAVAVEHKPPEALAPAPLPIEAVRPAAVPKPQPVLAKPGEEAAEPYAHARALREKGDFASAVAELRRTIETEPQFAETARYELGTLLDKQLHQREEALAEFQQYRLRYSAGTFVPEVDFAILRIQSERGHSDEALSEANHFLAAHSELKDQADQVRLLRGKLLGDRGDFSHALEDYRAVSRPVLLDDATFSIAYCQKQLGDRAGAVATLHAYLARFPQGRHHDEARRALGDE